MIIKIMKRHPQGDAVSFKLGGRFVVVQFFVWFGFWCFCLFVLQLIGFFAYIILFQMLHENGEGEAREAGR